MFGREVNVNERTVRRWVAGTNDPPEALVAWLETLAAFHAAHRGGAGGVITDPTSVHAGGVSRISSGNAGASGV